MRLLLFLCLLCIHEGVSFAPAGNISVRAARIASHRTSTLSRDLDLDTERRLFAVPSSLHGTADEESTAVAAGDGDGGAKMQKKMQNKIASRKQRVVVGYSIVSAAYGFFTLTALVKYKFSYGASFIAAGIVLPAGFAYILKGAAENDRLSSDTYKRLNLMLGAYALIGLLAKDIITTFHAGWVATCFVAVVNSIKGFGYGLKGWELKPTPIVAEFVEGARATIATLMRLPKTLSAAGYQASTLAFTAWKLSTLWKLGTLYLLNHGKGMLLAEPTNRCLALAFQIKKLLLLQVMSFTLKDAADRERLNGTTFIQLNFLNFVASAVLAGKSSERTSPQNISIVCMISFCRLDSPCMLCGCLFDVLCDICCDIYAAIY